MTKKIEINPLTRIEGHLSIHTKAESTPENAYRITDAHCKGEMFRGFETILRGRDPLDAQQITQRICGVCPISHGMASVMAQEMAYGINPTRNGRLAQNLIFAANWMQSHIMHFYLLAALDWMDIKSILRYRGENRTLLNLKSWVQEALEKNVAFPGAPFLPRYEVDQYAKSESTNIALLNGYMQALKMRATAHEMAAVFGAKLPHSTSLVPTGVTGEITMERVLAYRSRLEELTDFIENIYLPDLLRTVKEFPSYAEIGGSYPNYLSFGAFRMEEASGENIEKYFPAGVVIDGNYQRLETSRIKEFVANSRYQSQSGLHPYEGHTDPDPDKGYSWLKAPRYKGMPMQVGPLARIVVAYHTPGMDRMKEDIDTTLEATSLTLSDLNSVLGRHLARGLEVKWLCHQCRDWLDGLELQSSAATQFEIPKTAKGYGLTEAPRGALGHWLTIEDHKIENYQCVVPTTWNCSPRDDQGQPGPMEKALEGTVIQDPDQPLESGRIVRSFDPCLACAVH